MELFNNNYIPSNGYRLEKWEQIGYRATAIAYMKRENVSSVKNTNGNEYSLQQLENAIIGQNTKSREASKVLQLMDNDFSYKQALETVLSDNPTIHRESLENELNRYI